MIAICSADTDVSQQVDSFATLDVPNSNAGNLVILYYIILILLGNLQNF